jgi:hypothetical protein
MNAIPGCCDGRRRQWVASGGGRGSERWTWGRWWAVANACRLRRRAGGRISVVRDRGGSLGGDRHLQAGLPTCYSWWLRWEMQAGDAKIVSRGKRLGSWLFFLVPLWIVSNLLARNLSYQLVTSLLVRVQPAKVHVSHWCHVWVHMAPGETILD